MNRQEIFDKVVTHLFAQGKRSLDEDGMCTYRGEGGTMCAVGCLIPDEVYNPNMEGNAICVLLAYLMKNNIEIPGFSQENKDLLLDLQRIHDSERTWFRPGALAEALGDIAETYELNPFVLKGKTLHANHP